MPEVSLVAILDADKEGFLRSERSLIQTIGRTARNSKGVAILYADTITKSIRAAIEETERRRNKQIEHNKKHGITPTTIRKKVADVMEGAYGSSVRGRNSRQLDKAAETSASYSAMSPDKALKEITKLEKQMYQHAKDLEFEEAAHVRDKISQLREQIIKSS
ncbi:UvrABC system protein B [Nymphon striatum]|nr:UvrABC system protein B [Nymphon striatum]